MAGPFDFLHIKGRTAGSSNELSFDVLDAVSKDASKQEKRASKTPTGPKSSQGSYHGVAGTSTLSAVPEVERRKRARRVRSVRLWAIAAFAVIALVGTGVYFGYHFHQDRVDFSGRFNLLIDRFVEIDRTLVEVDSLMGDPLNSVEAVERSEASERFASLNRELNAVMAEAREMEASALVDRDRAALSEIEVAANARADMLAAAESAFTLSKHANQLADEANTAWNSVLEADELAREATAIANKAQTEGATLDAQDKTKRARDLLQSVRTGLDHVEKEESRISFATEKAYIDKRVQALDAAIDTADALLGNDRTRAREANDTYNAADKEAATLALALPSSISDQVKLVYETDLDTILETYAQARASVTTADSALRAYL